MTESLTGTIFDNKYEILGLIGAGGFGSVYQARQVTLSRTVAIKVLNGSVPDDDVSRARFEREAQAISSLKHRNIVLFYGYGHWRNTPYMVMELVRGESLDRLLQGGQPLSPEFSLTIMKQVAEALACAHANGVIHRDLKPSNIMLVTMDTGETLVKLIDFGLAKVLPGYARQSQQLTEAGIAIGSVLYMSPEQCRGKMADARSDIYAAGCILYQCLSGLPPFHSDNSVAVMYQHLHQEAAPLLSAPVPNLIRYPNLQPLITKALAKDPDDRFQSMDEMLEAIDLAIEHVKTGSGPDSSSDTYTHTCKSNTTPSAEQIKAATIIQKPHEPARAADDRFLRRLPIALMAAGVIPIIATLIFFPYLPERLFHTSKQQPPSENSMTQFRRFDSTFRHLSEKGAALSDTIALGENILASAETDKLLGPNEQVITLLNLSVLYGRRLDWRNAIECARRGLKLQEKYGIRPNTETYQLATTMARSADEGFHRRSTIESLEKFTKCISNTELSRHYQQLLRIDLASLCLNIGNIDLAKGFAQTAMTPDNDDAFESRRVDVLSNLEFHEGNVKGSIASAEAALSKQADTTRSGPNILYRQALAYLQIGDIASADRTIATFEKIEGNQAWTGGLTMIKCARNKQWKEASQWLRIVLKSADDNIVNYYRYYYYATIKELARLAREAHETELANLAEEKNASYAARCRQLQ